MDSKVWYQELMTQKFYGNPSKDITRLLLVYYVLEKELFNKNFKKIELLEYIYAFYIDNVTFSSIHSNVIIRNICKYGLKDIEFLLNNALFDWKSDFPNGCLSFDDMYINISIKDLKAEVISSTKKICDMLFYQTTFKTFNYENNLIELKDITNYDLDIINKSRIKNRVLADMQYCVLCDNAIVNDLYAIPLSNDTNLIKCKDNYVLVCKKHYDLYMNSYIFKSNGFINIIKNSSELNKNMHIPLNVLRGKRKNILNK